MVNFKDEVLKLQGEVNSLVLYEDLIGDSVIKMILNLENRNKILKSLIDEAEEKGYTGDLWKNHIIGFIEETKNPFSLAAEKGLVNKESSIYKLAILDFKHLINIYKFDISNLFGEDEAFILKNYNNCSIKNEGIYILQKILESGNHTKITEYFTKFYFENGCGLLNKYKAFRYDEKLGLVGIKGKWEEKFEDLIGCKDQKNTLISNTKAFLQGKPANNALLYGDRGTGKSSSVKALINEFGDKGLRLIEINRHQLRCFSEVINIIKNRGLHFIIFMDDLSFENFETDYKYLKSVIEGGLEGRPDNVLIYATSNRRHIIKETWEDREGKYEEINNGEAIQEKLSLVDRFGLTIIYPSPNQNEYLDIVEGIASKLDINMDMEDIKKEALQWQMWHNGRSGRTAKQFINNLLGRE
ncbi:ATP-binding protein [Clostridium oryzae]|uniref:Replication factor C large subunit n=1 Tax=Clostridium oryzae TaxID=1450648 RepID=A0A1V4IBV0_9CLOT|nr:ATP-binding protein [Clostridium oryzae]OPJ57478.1 replication factor C large subunit [Clostridium oryzae]